MYKWMNGLEKFEPISGNPGQVGAKSKLTFKMKNRKMEMIEAIRVKDLPREFSGTYEMKVSTIGFKIVSKNCPLEKNSYSVVQELSSVVL